MSEQTVKQDSAARTIDPAVLACTPADAAVTGYLLYKMDLPVRLAQNPDNHADELDLAVESLSDGPEARLAIKVLFQDFFELRRSYELKSPERRYLNRYLQAVLVYCIGLNAAKRDHKYEYDKIIVHEYYEIERSVLTSSFWGLMRGAATIATSGGLTALIAALVAILVPQAAPHQALIVSGIAGLAATAFTIAYLSGKTGKSLERIQVDTRARKDLADAKQEAENSRCRNRALSIAREAWVELTGTEFRNNTPTELALLSLQPQTDRDRGNGAQKQAGRISALLRIARMIRRVATFRRAMDARAARVIKQRPNP